MLDLVSLVCYFQRDFSIPLTLVSYCLSLLIFSKADPPAIVLVCHDVSGKDEIQKRRMIWCMTHGGMSQRSVCAPISVCFSVLGL